MVAGPTVFFNQNGVIGHNRRASRLELFLAIASASFFP
jgi:hypothetical protein